MESYQTVYVCPFELLEDADVFSLEDEVILYWEKYTYKITFSEEWADYNPATESDVDLSSEDEDYYIVCTGLCQEIGKGWGETISTGNTVAESLARYLEEQGFLNG